MSSSRPADSALFIRSALALAQRGRAELAVRGRSQTEPDRDTPQFESFMKASTSGRALITSWLYKA